ncbi:MAG TPA: hypothetical protein VFR67_31480 [Pilimelia sp.]|nr:hypothetical protein [Pilimelia sp.]
MTATTQPASPPEVDRPAAEPVVARRPWPLRWAPAAAAATVVVALLVDTGTPIADIVRYAGYALLAVMLPGTLVYRALRRRPHTLVEDLAVGAAVGLVLELAAWACFSAVGAQRWLWLWPAAVVVPFVAVPALRRHWRVRGHRPVPLGWAWSVAAVVAGFTWYLAESFLRRNPILPADESQAQYIDLAFQMSIAGEATHAFPPQVPQAAGEPLHYHWFGFAHLGIASLVSHVDLPTIVLRLGVPALCALAIVLVAVVGWRVSGRPYVGAAAAALMFTIGEFGYENGVRQFFGTQATFIVWGSQSVTYSWVLLIPLIAVLGDIVGRARGSEVPPLGRGAWALAALFLLGSTGAKASTIPVVLAALGLTAVVLLAVRRRVVWPVVAAAGVALAAQVFATAVLFRFENHGATVAPFAGFTRYVPPDADRPGWLGALLFAAVAAAFLLNMQLRLAGIPVLLWRRRGRLEPVQVFLLGGVLAGPAIYVLVTHPGGAQEYFVRASFVFGVILSAWGYAEAMDAARLPRPALAGLGFGAAAFAVGLAFIQLRNPATAVGAPAYELLMPLLRWAFVLFMLGALAGLAWSAAGDRWRVLRGRGGVVALTAVLVAGAPGLVMDAAAARTYANGGAYASVPMPQSRVAAARWVHDNSDPDDVVATNVHCREVVNGWCDARTFWLSAYAERTVLVEGWAFAPRMVGEDGGPYAPFWDQPRLELNDEAFYAPTAANLATLRREYGVRWLVADRDIGAEAPELARLADRRYDNGRIAVYEIRA